MSVNFLATWKMTSFFQRTSLVIKTSLVGTHADQDNGDKDLEGTVSKQNTHIDQDNGDNDLEGTVAKQSTHTDQVNDLEGTIRKTSRRQTAAAASV